MITDPKEIEKIRKFIQEGEEMERDTKLKNRNKGKNPAAYNEIDITKRKPKSNYPSRQSHQKKQKPVEPTEYEPGSALSKTGFAKDGQSVRKRFGLKYPPKSRAKQNDMANELVTWSLHTDSLQIEDFPILCGVSPKRFFDVAHKNEYFKECLDIARHNIGSRIFHGVANREIDKSLPSHVYPLYNQQYNDHLKERQEQKQAQSQIQTIEIPASPSTEMVPERTIDSRGYTEEGSSSEALAKDEGSTDDSTDSEDEASD